MPYSTLVVRSVVLLCFPTSDVVFATLVRRTFESSTTNDPTGLQQQVRAFYPRAIVRAREALASFGGSAWYVYRDGRYSPFGRGRRWWGDAGTARMVLNDDGRYLEANDAMVQLLGISSAELMTQAAGSLAVPEYGSAIPWILQLLRDTGELHSTGTIRPRDGRPELAIEFHLTKDAAGPGRHVSWMRAVPAEAAAPSVADPSPGAHRSVAGDPVMDDLPGAEAPPPEANI